jgi:hypothetical protein
MNCEHVKGMAWANLKHIHGSSAEGLRNTTKNLRHYIRSPADM